MLYFSSAFFFFLFLVNKLQLLEQCTSYLTKCLPTLSVAPGHWVFCGFTAYPVPHRCSQQKARKCMQAWLVWVWDMGWEWGFPGQGRRQRKWPHVLPEGRVWRVLGWGEGSSMHSLMHWINIACREVWPMKGNSQGLWDPGPLLERGPRTHKPAAYTLFWMVPELGVVLLAGVVGYCCCSGFPSHGGGDSMWQFICLIINTTFSALLSSFPWGSSSKRPNQALSASTQTVTWGSMSTPLVL